MIRRSYPELRDEEDMIEYERSEVEGNVIQSQAFQNSISRIRNLN